MGSDTGSLSPREQHQCSNTKKRFSQGDMYAAVGALKALEMGTLQSERDPASGICIIGGNANGYGGGSVGVGVLHPAVVSTAAHEIGPRLHLRARLQELASFVAWFGLIISCTMQYAMVWVAFWHHVEAVRNHVFSFHRRSVSLSLLGLWVAGLFLYRRMIYSRIAPDLRSLLRHAEVLACVVLWMTDEIVRRQPGCFFEEETDLGSAVQKLTQLELVQYNQSSSVLTDKWGFITVTVNFASFVHTPGEPLFDIGFLIVPAQSETSPWRPVSDELTVLLPAIALVRVLFIDRVQRVALITSWFRMISIVYLLRSLTIGLTSMPGPAPHCRDFALYNPPSNWHEILTRMDVQLGDFSSCGDLLFSGHAAFTTLTMLVFVKSWAGHPTHGIWKALGVVYVLSMCTLAIAGRKHYTVDIILGILIASFTFFSFENGWRAASYGPRGSTSPTAARKAVYDPHTEKKESSWIV